MITKEQAVTAWEFHLTSACQRTVGYRCRRNGVTQQWKRDTDKFRVPVKHGLYQYGQIDNYNLNNAHLFHTAEDCPLVQILILDCLLRGTQS